MKSLKKYFAAYTQFHGQVFVVEIDGNTLNLVVRNNDGSFKEVGKSVEITSAETVNVDLFGFQPRYQFIIEKREITVLQSRKLKSPPDKKEKEWILEKACDELLNSVKDLFPENKHIQYAE